MKFFRLIPDANGYSWKPSIPAASRIEVEGGFDVRRREYIGATDIFNLTFTLNPETFEYLDDFLDEYFKEPAWFHMLLLGFPVNETYPLERYAVQVLPGTYNLDSVDGLRYKVSMQVEGYPDPGQILTSSLYSMLVTDSLKIKYDLLSGKDYIGSWTDYLSGFPVELLSGTLRAPLIQYPAREFDSVKGISYALLEGDIRSILKGHDGPEYDSVTSLFSYTPDNNSLKVILIVYQLGVPEAIRSPITLLSGTLS